MQSLWQRFLSWLTIVFEGEQRPSRRNIDVLDGVRAIACLCVITVHITLITTRDVPLWSAKKMPALISAVAHAGDSGVTLFFVLSGFLLFLPYAKALLFAKDDWPSTRRFYLRRALRILPAYYLSLVLIVFIYRADYRHLDHLPQWGAFLTLLMDSFSSTYKQINGPFWTLAVEWQFYMVLPWLALGMSLLVRRGSTLARRIALLLLCLGFLGVWGVFSRYIGFFFTQHHGAGGDLQPILDRILPFIYGARNPGVHGKFMEAFALGMLVSTLYVLAQYLPPASRYHQTSRRLAPWAFGSSLILLLLIAMWRYNQGNLGTWPLFNRFAGVYGYLNEPVVASGYVLFMASMLFAPPILQRIGSWRPLRWFGAMSYGIYIWHLLLLELFTDLVVKNLYGYGWPPLLLYSFYWVWLLIFVIPCAFLLFWLVERPWMALGQPRKAVEKQTGARPTSESDAAEAEPAASRRG